jgi:hypothetical protein
MTIKSSATIKEDAALEINHIELLPGELANQTTNH